MMTIEEYRAAIFQALLDAKNEDGTQLLSEKEAREALNGFTDDELQDGILWNSPEDVANIILEGLEYFKIFSQEAYHGIHDTLLSFYTLYFNSCKRNRIVERNVLFSISFKNEIKKYIMRNISLRNSIIICKFAAAKSKLCSIRSDFPLG